MQDRVSAQGSEQPEFVPGLLRFRGLALDLDACTLTRETGQAIALTRTEFALLRFMSRRPGRVLSRDTLLDAVSNRKMEPFDRSIDVLVSRLRAKIEIDPRQPKLIVTVPGEGYRFDAFAIDKSESGAFAVHRPDMQPPHREANSPGRDFGARHVVGSLLVSRPRRRAAAAVALAALVLAAALWATRPNGRLNFQEPVVAVLTFSDFGGSETENYFGEGLTENLRTLLSTFPGIRVLSQTPPAASRGVVPDTDFVLRGGVVKSLEKVRVTTQLIDGRTGHNVWADHFDEDGADIIAIEDAIADRIYNSVAGLAGSIRSEEERAAWRKASSSLGEYDYYLRGSSYIVRLTCDDNLKARAIFEEGLRKYPASALLRVKLAFTYSNAVELYCSADPRGDIERAWTIGREALAAEDKSRLTIWLGHWLMAALYQWRDQDFDRSVNEAEMAARLVPYDARSRASLSFYLANAGRLERAVEWSTSAMKSPDGKFACQNLAWAFYLMGKLEDSRDVLERKCDPTEPGYQQQLATVFVRLGRIDDARAIIRTWMEKNPQDTIGLEANWPLKPEYKAAYVADLREAGMPN
jgi:TolB-like protein/DNA-binding winged helix-turn-helix (wHTH) protein